MKNIFDELYATTPGALPGAASLEIRSFLLRRNSGNLLVYGTGVPADDVREIGYLDAAREAFVAGLQLNAVVSAVCMVILATLTAVLLRRVPAHPDRDGASETGRGEAERPEPLAEGGG